MKKNLRGCIEQPVLGECRVLVDMNQFEAVERAGFVSDRAHNRSAHMTARWQFSECPRAVLATGGVDLSGMRHLTFSVFAIGGEGGSFSLMLDSSTGGEGKDGYECTLPITRDGWNSYRVEIPFMRAVGEPLGLDRIESIRFDCVAGGQANRHDTKLYLDNLFVWKGDAPPLYATAPELKGAAVFSRTGGFSIVDRKRIFNTPDGTLAKPFEREGILWVPMAPIAAGIAHSAVVDTIAATLSFTYRRKKYVFTGGVAKVSVNGEAQPLPVAPVSIEGTLFFPCGYVREFFRWRQTFIDPTGLVVLSNRKNIYDSRRDADTVWQLLTDTTFVRPDAERVLADLHRNFPNPARGRLFASFDELMQLRRDAKTDPQLGGYVAALTERYGVKSEAFSATDADDGEAILAFAMLYRITGDKQYAERVWTACESICVRSDWGGLSEMAATARNIVIAYDWCRHVWSEGRKALIERALLRVAMRPILETLEGRGRMWRLGGVHAAEANCTAVVLSLALADVYPQTALRLLNSALCNVEACFAAFAPDGGMPESVGAWERSARALYLMQAALVRACGSDYGLGAVTGFSATARFPLYTETVNGSWNYHDDAAHAVDTSLAFRMSAVSGNPVAAWMRRRALLTGQKRVHPFDILFYRPVDDNEAPSLPLDAFFRRAGLAVMRAGWENDAAYLGLHGGRNHMPSGDLDAGTFLLEMGGVRFFEDTGAVESLPMLLRRRAAGQNTISVEPGDETTPDQNPDAVVPVCEMRSSPSRAYAVVDMTSTSDLLLRAKRGAMLTDDRSVAVIQDELTLTRPADVVWTAWTRAEVKLNASGRVAMLKKDGKVIAVRLCGVSAPARFETVTPEGSDFTCLRVVITGREKLRMAVVCRLLEAGDSAARRVYEVVPISRWGEI